MYKLDVSSRNVNDSTKKLRKSGVIPAVYYHKGEESIVLSVKASDFHKAIQSHDSVLKLSNNKMAIVKSVDRDPVSHQVLHVNFEGVVAGETFTKVVPVRLVHDEKTPWMAVKMNLNQVLNEIEVETTPDKLPEFIECDVTNLDKDHGLKVKDLPKLDGVTYLDEEDRTVASLVHQKVVVEEPKSEEVPVEATEVVTEDKSEEKEE